MVAKYLCGFICLLSSLHGTEILPEQLKVQQRTNEIYHRFYLIKRLNESIQALASLNLEKIGLEKVLIDEALFTHNEVIKIIHHIQRKNNLSPLLLLWDQFKSYKHIYDKQFSHEFIELIYLLFELIRPNKMKNAMPKEMATLDAIDYFVDHMDQETTFPVIKKIEERDVISTDTIARRFFTIKRLDKSMQVLNYIASSFYGASNRSQSFLDDILQEISRFEHDRIKECILMMCEQKKLDPLVRVCREFKQYRYAQDDSFLQEMLMNIFLVYKSLLFKNLSAHTEQVIMAEMNQVLEIYEQLETLPLDETLEAIDMVTDKLITIQALENQKKNSLLKMLPIVGSISLSLGLLAGIYYFITHKQ